MNYNQKDHSHCPPKNSPCGNEGEHRCCLCLKPKDMTQDWKEKIVDVLSNHYNDIFYGDVEPEKQNDGIINFIESLLKEERNAILSEVEREVEKKLEKWDESAEELEDGWGNYTVCLPWELKEKKLDISTTINNLRVK